MKRIDIKNAIAFVVLGAVQGDVIDILEVPELLAECSRDWAEPIEEELADKPAPKTPDDKSFE